ncbi:MAG: hypothetical protein AAFY31_12525 [Pseudomonadota bacterium]
MELPLSVLPVEYQTIALVLALLVFLPPLAMSASKMWQVFLMKTKAVSRERAIKDPVFQKHAIIARVWMAAFFGSMYGIANI